MKRKFTYSILSVLVIASVLFILKINKTNNQYDRKDYEKFLNKKYKEIKNIPEKEEGLEKMDCPDMAVMQDYFMTLDPKLGYVPAKRLKKAYKTTIDLIKNKDNFFDAIEWQGTSAKMGGRTRAIMWDPNDASLKKVWAGGVTGGLWYNNDITDEASQWYPVNDFWDNLSISCITYDPNNPMIMYVGTGEAQTAVTIYRESSSIGFGIFKSVDGGQSWNLIPSTEDFAYITDIAIRNENGISVIYAGVVSGFYKGAQHQSTPSDGLYRSDDGGQSWQQVLPDIINKDLPYAPADIAIASDGRIFVGSMRNLNGDGGSTILYSDDGIPDSWTIYDNYYNIIINNPSYYIPGRVMLANAPSDANIVYAFYSVGTNDNLVEGFGSFSCKYILKTENKGETWQEVNLPSDDWAYLSWHALTAAVDPNNANTVFAGGMDVYKSLNGGQSWNRLSDWSLMYYGGGDDYVHADQHAQVFKPNSSSEIIFSSDGGVFYSSNADENNVKFMERNNNYNTLQYYTCAINPVAGTNKLIGGLQDNGSLYYTGSPLTINDMVEGGDGAYCFYDEDEPNLFIVSIYDNRYSVFNNGSYYQDIGNYSCGTFINPADYDSRYNTLYANAMTFEGSRKDMFVRIKGIPDNIQGNYLFLNTGSEVPYSHIKLSPNSPENKATLFIGTQSGRLFKVENAQDVPEVSEITGTDFPFANISCISVGNSDDTLLVTFSNYGVTSVWQTLDGSLSWKNKEGNLPDMPIRWCLYHPDNTNQAMLATETGIWTTDDLSAENVIWHPENTGMANVRVDMLSLRKADNTVCAASHGRGLFTASYDVTTSIDENNSVKNIKVFPNPNNGEFTIDFNNYKSGNLNIMINDVNGKIIFSDNLKNFKGVYHKKINISKYSKGIYILNIINNSKKYSQKIIYK